MSNVNETTKFDRTKLNSTQLEFIKNFELQNRERALRLRVLKKRNWFTGLALGATVLGIYSYSIWAVKQETFLDDFDEPAKLTE